MTRTARRLIEADLPIREISRHARREKSIRHGHISTLHTWWARRPLAACRAVVLGALLPDPADPGCPEAFREAAAKALRAFTTSRWRRPRRAERRGVNLASKVVQRMLPGMLRRSCRGRDSNSHGVAPSRV